ncbi:unnamed protein product [Pleuronectes platessa]|uniref:Uncharacterized protein n=1 Tax=Pleuronectes platessa TaxID=8262 RepID=A0A9N7YIB9_PLEPL|nr:unnamed protein product [Pleuronectes platessa]
MRAAWWKKREGREAEGQRNNGRGDKLDNTRDRGVTPEQMDYTQTPSHTYNSETRRNGNRLIESLLEKTTGNSRRRRMNLKGAASAIKQQISTTEMSASQKHISLFDT